MNVINSLSSISGYPIQASTLDRICGECGLDANVEATTEVFTSKPYVKAKAHVLLYLVDAPNVSQGGISFSFTATEKSQMRKKAIALLNSIGENDPEAGTGSYGYVGSDF